jgi:hypothetical protein
MEKKNISSLGPHEKASMHRRLTRETGSGYKAYLLLGGKCEDTPFAFNNDKVKGPVRKR